jgi:hypothetical protein
VSVADDRQDAGGVEAPFGELTAAWHVTSSVNRGSILEHGLDWRRMGGTGGVASGVVCRGPEMEAVFLCEGVGDAEFFLGFGTHPRLDVWKVDVTGLMLEPGPDGWVIHRRPIAAHRLQLVRHDVSASPPPLPPPDATTWADARVVLRDELRIKSD